MNNLESLKRDERALDRNLAALLREYEVAKLMDGYKRQWKLRTLIDDVLHELNIVRHQIAEIEGTYNEFDVPEHDEAAERAAYEQAVANYEFNNR